MFKKISVTAYKLTWSPKSSFKRD